MLKRAALVLALIANVVGAQTRMIIPTSVAVDIAKVVADGEGYSLIDRRSYFFDLMTDKTGRPAFQGYVTMGFYWHGDLVNSISINERTAQVLDINECVVFEYPNLRVFQTEATEKTGAKPLGNGELVAATKCPSLKRVREPAKKKSGL